MKNKELKELLESGEVYIFPPGMEKVTAVDKDGVVFAGLCITQDLLDLAPTSTGKGE
jgi:hypothetical protein